MSQRANHGRDAAGYRSHKARLADSSRSQNATRARCATNASTSVAPSERPPLFTPTLLIGACTGLLVATGLHAVFGDAIAAPGSYVLVGLAATLAATTHAPLMSALLACELSGDYQLVLPLLVACAIASGVARRLYIDSVYTAELTRRGLRWRLTLDGRRVLESQQNSTDVV